MTISALSAPAAAWQIRDYAPGDEDQVLGLLSLSLGGGTGFVRDRVFWRWKHFANPFGPSQLLLATMDDVVGLRAFMRWRFAIPGGQVSAVRAVDTATHPGRRRLGVFSRLTSAAVDRARSDGVHLIFNTPNAHSMPGYLKLGWSRLAPPAVMIRPLRPERIAAAMLRRRNGRRAEEEAAFVRRPPDSVSSLLRSEGIEELIRTDDALRAAGIRTARSVAYLRWRYEAVPSMSYAALSAGPLARGAAAIVRSRMRRGLREIMLSELLIGDGGGAAVRELVRALLAASDADYVAAAAAPRSVHWTALRRSGFLPVPWIGPNFTVLPLNWTSPRLDPTRAASWQLSLGDLEIF